MFFTNNLTPDSLKSYQFILYIPQENNASKNPQYRQDHWFQRGHDFHGFCWFDYISNEEEKIVRSLPAADGISGKNSDYCK